MKKCLVLILATVLLLCGCTAGQGATGAQLGSAPTVEDIFTAQPATSGVESTPSSTNAAATAPTKPDTTDWGGMGLGLPDGYRQNDGISGYVTYEGGMMHLPFALKSSGLASTYDLGILLFVDGVAQPYRVGPDGEYAYMHTFSQKDGVLGDHGLKYTTADIYFTPVTGEKGDVLELYALCMPNPEHMPSQGAIGFTRTFGAVTFATRMKYNATPPEDVYPEKSTRLLDVSTSVVDCTAEDVENWTAEDMITDQRTAFTANGENPRVYGVTEDAQIILHYEVWGSPYVHYALIFFVDNEPVYTTDLSDIWVTVEMGQKTVIEATLDMTGFSGESAVYAILVPRNYYTSEIETNASFHQGSTIYLLAKEKGT